MMKLFQYRGRGGGRTSVDAREAVGEATSSGSDPAAGGGRRVIGSPRPPALEPLEPRLLLSADLPMGEAYQQDDDEQGLVVIDTTIHDGRVDGGDHVWEQIADADAADGRAMQVLPADHTSFDKGFANAAAELQFQIKFAHTVPHYVWILGQGEHHRHSHSVHVGLNGEQVETATAIEALPRNAYAWRSATEAGSAAMIEVRDDIAVLNLWMHHAGVIVDRILLTPDPDFTPTGEGPPLSDRIDATLGTISGVVWNDLDGDGVRDPHEPGLENINVFLDLDNTGQLDPGDPTTLTNAQGEYLFEGVAPGDYTVGIISEQGIRQTTPVASAPNWTGELQEQRLSEPSALPHTDYGDHRSLAVHEDVAVVGAPRLGPGTAFVYRHINGQWRFEAQLHALLRRKAPDSAAR